jgi:hypothetical protein
MPDVIITIPGATNVTVDDAPATSIVVIFPASNYVVTTVIDRGILFGVEGPSGPAGGVNTINGQSGDVNLDTSEIPENPSNLYFTTARVRDTLLTGLSLATNAVISATDSVLIAFGKLQAQITANLSTLTSHTSNTSNPHATTKAQVGLGNADNTSDANKPISTATQTALNAKQATLVSGTNIKTINYTSLLGSGNVAVQPTLVSGTNIKTINGTSVLGSGDIVTSVQLSYRHDFNVYDYLGKAASGSSESASVWTITRLTIASDGTATVGTATNVTWTGRYTHIYT